MTKPNKTIKEFHPEVLSSFHDYVHGGIDRRGFLKQVSKFAVGGLTAAAILDSLQPKYAEAQEIHSGDPRVEEEYITIPSPQNWQCLLSRPANRSTENLPAVLVIHENRGRNPYIEDVTRRLALVGFMAMSPDALSPMGGWPGNDDDGRTMQRELDREEMMSNWQAALNYLKQQMARWALWASATEVAWSTISPRACLMYWMREFLFMAVKLRRRKPRTYEHRCCSRMPAPTLESWKELLPMKQC